MTKDTEVWTSDKLAALIEKKYPSEQGSYNPTVVLHEVHEDTGLAKGRIDTVVFHLWQMHGLTRSAFEIKISRADFLRELAQPEKHKWVQESFHEFWFVAPKDVIQVEELPIGAGWMYPRGEQLCIARNAVRNPNPKLDDKLLSSFMRSAWKMSQAIQSKTLMDCYHTDPRYIRASMYEQAVTSFLGSRGSHSYDTPKDKEMIEAWLQEATMDKEMKADRDKLITMLDSFQRRLMESLSEYTVLAGSALLAKDELGKYILSTWGGNDKAAIEVLYGQKKKNKDDREKLTDMVRENVIKEVQCETRSE